jgi:hypothetical protein
MNFNEWVFEVCQHLAFKTLLKYKDEQYFYERIDLTDAKLQFKDNVKPTEYKPSF